MKKMTDAEFSGSSIERAWEPPEEVVVPYALAYAPGLQPEDYGVLIRLLLRDPDQPSGIVALAEEFQASGWKMGSSRLRGVLGRLQKAGHVSHERDGYDKETGRPKWRFRVYRNPANNSAYVNRGAAAASQVSPTVRNPTRRGAQVGSDDAISNIYAGQADSAISNTSEADSAVSDTSESNIYAGQADDAVSDTSAPSPPHPPEEVTTSSPNPLTSPTGRRSASPGEEGRVFAPEETAAALRLLQLLPQPWSVGRPRAKALAPALLEAMADQGWPKITGLDDRTQRLLVEQLTKNPGGIKNHGSILGRDRIPNLPLFEVVAGAGIPAQGSAPRPALPTQDPERRTTAMPAGLAALASRAGRIAGPSGRSVSPATDSGPAPAAASREPASNSADVNALLNGLGSPDI
ncbi:hypothetical protein AB0O82_32605 [Kitasatospora sp. NPDC088264]|uniref:hypothetical protein n=1 Tax=Kitasatospora sp. NPDC088264 TaxID=3155296 RepID=UPI0034281CE6